MNSRTNNDTLDAWLTLIARNPGGNYVILTEDMTSADHNILQPLRSLQPDHVRVDYRQRVATIYGARVQIITEHQHATSYSRLRGWSLHGVWVDHINPPRDVDGKLRDMLGCCLAGVRDPRVFNHGTLFGQPLRVTA